jgi:diguanylate cyclase (GGDEF)-like protein
MSAGTGSDRPSGIAAASDAERRLRTDPLTQIASKVQLLEWLEGRDAWLLALLDVDDFRILNHSLGHDFGDASLQVLARRLETANAGPGRHVARLGQDEFAVLSAPDETAERFGRRLQAVFAEPFRIGDRQVRLRATYGISRCSTNKAPNDVIREADIPVLVMK